MQIRYLITIHEDQNLFRPQTALPPPYTQVSSTYALWFLRLSAHKEAGRQALDLVTTKSHPESSFQARQKETRKEKTRLH